jgi:hypothetical protein
MTIEDKRRWLFGVNAVINWIVSIRGIVDPVGMAIAFGGAAPNYPFMLRLWSAFVFMFGCMFWEVSRHPVTKHSLAKYNWQNTFRAEFHNGAYTDDDIVDVFTQRITTPFHIYKNVFIPNGLYHFSGIN